MVSERFGRGARGEEKGERKRGSESVRSVEAAGDVGMVDEREEFFVGAAGPVTVGFAQVDIDEGFVLDGGHCSCK